MKRFFKLYIRLTESWSKPIVIILLFLLILAFNLFIFPYFPGICPGEKATSSVSAMLDTRIYYSAEDVKTFLSSKTEAEKKCSIIVHLTVDTVYPLVYSVFLSILFSLLVSRLAGGLNKVPGRRPKLFDRAGSLFIIFPLFILIADYLENTFILILLAGSGTGSDTLSRPLAYITPVVTTVKWAFVLINLAVLLILTSLRIYRSVYKKG